MLRKKKIAVIGLKGLPAFGGAAAVGENIIKQLKDKYDFTVYATSSHTNLKTGYYNGYKQIVFKKLPFKRLNILYYYIISAFHAVLLGKHDIVHLHHRDAAFIIPFLKVKYKVLLSTHQFGNVVDKWKKYKLFFHIQEKYFSNKADLITCVSKNESRTILKKLNRKVIYIPNGINLPDKVYKKNIKDYICFAAGRIIEIKGCHLLLEALHMIKYKGEVKIIGDLNQRVNYKSKILNLARALSIDFVGLVKDKNMLYKYIADSKLFIFPSLMEAMSIMLLEAVSLKVPLICSDIIENKDVFNEKEVLFFKSGDSYDLAEKITWALKNEKEISKKVKNAFKKLKNEYSWEIIAPEYDKIYTNLLNQNS